MKQFISIFAIVYLFLISDFKLLGMDYSETVSELQKIAIEIENSHNPVEILNKYDLDLDSLKKLKILLCVGLDPISKLKYSYLGIDINLLIKIDEKITTKELDHQKKYTQNIELISQAFAKRLPNKLIQNN